MKLFDIFATIFIVFGIIACIYDIININRKPENKKTNEELNTAKMMHKLAKKENDKILLKARLDLIDIEYKIKKDIFKHIKKEAKSGRMETIYYCKDYRNVPNDISVKEIVEINQDFEHMTEKITDYLKSKGFCARYRKYESNLYVTPDPEHCHRGSCKIIISWEEAEKSENKE